jgi:SAM-dependent methyltransferase
MKEIVDILSDTSPDKLRINIGCGATNMGEGWKHLDQHHYPHITHYVDLEKVGKKPLSFESDSVDVLYASHVLEHITNLLPLMEELYRIAKEGAVFIITVPHGSADSAYEDPTHVRHFFDKSPFYFGQSYYQGNKYNYTADWKCEKIVNVLNDNLQGAEFTQVRLLIEHGRNAIIESNYLLRKVPFRHPPMPLDECPVAYVWREEKS